MAEDGERIATTTAVEKDSQTVRVTCLVDGLRVSGFINKTPKNADIYVKFSERGFDLKASFKGKGQKVFRKIVKKLPGAIDIEQSTWKAEKDKVVINLVKASSGSWAVPLSQRGLEQQSDEEEEDN